MNSMETPQDVYHLDLKEMARGFHLFRAVKAAILSEGSTGSAGQCATVSVPDITSSHLKEIAQ